MGKFKIVQGTKQNFYLRGEIQGGLLLVLFLRPVRNT